MELTAEQRTQVLTTLAAMMREHALTTSTIVAGGARDAMAYHLDLANTYVETTVRHPEAGFERLRALVRCGKAFIAGVHAVVVDASLPAGQMFAKVNEGAFGCGASLTMVGGIAGVILAAGEVSEADLHRLAAMFVAGYYGLLDADSAADEALVA